jgi:hypothetical protein
MANKRHSTSFDSIIDRGHLGPPKGAEAYPKDGYTIRVKLLTLHHVEPPYTGGPSDEYTLFEGMSVYVGPPTQYVESESSGEPFQASQLQCAPYYRDWSTLGLLHISGEAIVPS